jgi:transcriptional regulator with XRE-family HTH domain
MNTFGSRLRSAVNKQYDTAKAFIEDCKSHNEAITPSEGMLGRYYNDKASPSIEKATLFAIVLGVSLDWLAGIETATADNSTVADLAREARGFRKDESIQLEPPPDSTIVPGYAFGFPGDEQLTIDFLIRGKEDRNVIPIGKHVPDTDE